MKLPISGVKGKTSIWVDVAIKEFFMKDFNSRQQNGFLNETAGTIVEKYKKDFKKEADNLAKMEHPGIVDILDTFEENNTCYLVMAYIDGQSLDAYITERGAIPEKEALQLIEKIADALHYMHTQHMLHLDLKPKNIMCSKENDTFIIDFGLSKQYDENDEPESSTTLGQGTQGYAPIEQGVPHSGHEFPMTIDVYALGATFYKMLTGKTPPYAAFILSTPEVIKRTLESQNVSKNITSTIVKAMNSRKEDRYKTVADFMKSLGLRVHNYAKHIQEPEVTVINENSEKTIIKSETDTSKKYEKYITTGCGKSKEHHKSATKHSLKNFYIKCRPLIITFFGLGLVTIVMLLWNSFKSDTINTVEYGDTMSNDEHKDEIKISQNDTERINIIKIPKDFVLVPGGQLNYNGNIYEEGKEHSVMLDSFYICKFELTQLEYKKIIGELTKFNYSWLNTPYWVIDDGPKYNKVRGDSIPVRGTYLDFINYCNKRSENEGYDGFYEIVGKTIKTKVNGSGYRLMTPYEWIFAAYGGVANQQDKYLGGNSLDQVAWHYGNSGGVPHPVGEKKPNIIGLYDMQGNASELLQGDEKRICYVSMVGGYDVSNFNYPQTYDPKYIWQPSKDSTWCYGTRIVLIPPNITNKNLEKTYDY